MHLANTKAAGLEFPGPAEGDAERDAAQCVANTRKDELTIDPGPRTVDRAEPGRGLRHGARSKSAPSRCRWARSGPMDSGRLLVLGGFGVAELGALRDRTIGNFADNDDWFDDVSDGPGRAVVTTADGQHPRGEARRG